MAGIVDDQEMVRPMVPSDKAHDTVVKLQLGFGGIGKLNNFGGIMEIASEELDKLVDLFTCEDALIESRSTAAHLFLRL